MIKTYLKMLWANKLQIIIFMSIFLVISIMNMMLQKKNEVTGEFEKIKTKVILMDETKKDERSRQLRDYLEKEYKIVKEASSIKEIKDALFISFASAGLVLKEDGTVDMYTRADSFVGAQNINEFLNMLAITEKYVPNMSEKLTTETMSYETEVRVLNRETMNKDALSLIKFYFNYLGYALVACFISIVYTGAYRFQQKSINERIRVSPVSLAGFSKNLYVGSAIAMFGIWLLFLIVGMIFGRKTLFSEKGFWLMLTSFVFVFPVAAIAYLCAWLSTSRNVNTILVNVVSLLLSFISGIFVPAQYLPKSMLRIASLFPTYWFQHTNEIIYQSVDISHDLTTIFQNYGIQFLITLAFLILTIFVSRIRKPSNDVQA